MGGCLHAKPHKEPAAPAVSKGCSMADYRIYKLDGSGKTTGPPYIVRCEDDDTVLDLARPLADGQTREIWEGARRVATISATSGERVEPQIG